MFEFRKLVKRTGEVALVGAMAGGLTLAGVTGASATPVTGSTTYECKISVPALKNNTYTVPVSFTVDLPSSVQAGTTFTPSTASASLTLPQDMLYDIRNNAGANKADRFKDAKPTSVAFNTTTSLSPSGSVEGEHAVSWPTITGTQTFDGTAPVTITVPSLTIDPIAVDADATSIEVRTPDSDNVTNPWDSTSTVAFTINAKFKKTSFPKTWGDGNIMCGVNDVNAQGAVIGTIPVTH